MILIFNKVKSLLNTSFNISDDILSMYVESAYNEACGYCNRTELPEEAYNNIAFLCITNIKRDYNQNINSLSEGGRIVNFGNSTNEQNKESALKGLKKWKVVRVV